VTIAAAFHVGGGIVVSADTQETFSGFKRNQSKIETRPRTYPIGSPCAVFVGAGDGPLIDHLVDKLWNAMEHSTRSLGPMIEACEKELTRVYQRLVPTFHPGCMPDAGLLVGVWCPPTSLELIEISGPILTRQIITKFIGCGDTLSSYINERLYKPKGGLADILPVAIYIVDEAKKHVDGVGGETHVATITDDGVIKRFHQFEIVPKTKKISEIDLAARAIAAFAMNEELDEKVVRAEIEQQVQAILDARR
jgi:hypothetical protein